MINNYCSDLLCMKINVVISSSSCFVLTRFHLYYTTLSAFNKLVFFTIIGTCFENKITILGNGNWNYIINQALFARILRFVPKRWRSSMRRCIIPWNVYWIFKAFHDCNRKLSEVNCFDVRGKGFETGCTQSFSSCL